MRVWGNFALISTSLRSFRWSTYSRRTPQISPAAYGDKKNPQSSAGRQTWFEDNRLIRNSVMISCSIYSGPVAGLKNHGMDSLKTILGRHSWDGEVGGRKIVEESKNGTLTCNAGGIFKAGIRLAINDSSDSKSAAMTRWFSTFRSRNRVSVVNQSRSDRNWGELEAKLRIRWLHCWAIQKQRSSIGSVSQAACWESSSSSFFNKRLNSRCTLEFSRFASLTRM